MADPYLKNTNLLRPETVGSRISEAAATAPARGMAAMGGAIGHVGQEIGGIGEKIQAAKNAAVMSEMRREAREEAAEFERDIIRNPDESEDKWNENWDRRMDAFEGGFSEREGLSPVARRQIELWTADFRSKHAMEIETKALQQTFARAKQSGLMEAEQSLADGNLPQAHAAVNAIPGQLPEWRDKVNGELTKKHDQNQIQATRQTDPWAMDEMEKPEWMPEGEWEKEKRASERMKSQIIAESIQDLFEKVKSGAIITTAGFIEALENDPFIPKSQHKRLIRNFEKNVPMNADEIHPYREMIKDLASWSNDPSMDPEVYEESYNFYMQELSMEGNRFGSRDLRKEMEYYSSQNRALRGESQTEKARSKADANVKELSSKQMEKYKAPKRRRGSKVDKYGNEQEVSAITARQWVEREVSNELASMTAEEIEAIDKDHKPGEKTWAEKLNARKWAEAEEKFGLNDPSGWVFDDEEVQAIADEEIKKKTFNRTNPILPTLTRICDCAARPPITVFSMTDCG